MKNDNQSPLFFSMTYEFLELYLPKQCGRSLHTVESYRDALSLFRRYVVDTLGRSTAKFTFAECTRDCVLGFMKRLSEWNSKATTRNQRLAALRSYLQFAADKDVSLQSIELEVRRVPLCRVTKVEKTVLPEEAVAAILQQPPNTKRGIRDRTLMILLYDSAARLAEVLGLSVSDVSIDGENPYIRVNGKGNKHRVVPISPRTAAHLAQYLSLYHVNERSGTQPLFYTVIKGETGMLSEANVERFIREHAHKAQVFCPSIPERVHPHMFRRTRATHLYQNGVDLPLVSRLLGHASLETTRVYAQPSLKMLREAIESVETSKGKTTEPIWEGDEAAMAKLSGLR